jgi:transposase-like protein
VLPTQEDFEQDLTARIRQAVQATMQVVLDEELERLVGAGPYQRSDERVDVRNGSYDLRLITAVALQAVSVWRDRSYLDMSLLGTTTT